MIAESATRVSTHTEQPVAEQIRRQTETNVAYFAAHPDQIDRRLRELDAEWDIERALETGSSTLTLTGLALSVLRGRRWLLLSLAVQGFFMQHALQGWCPPLPILRRLGFRTQYEIEQERYALKALRGDFATASEPGQIMEAARR
jgi:hypothetical protein